MKLFHSQRLIRELEYRKLNIMIGDGVLFMLRSPGIMEEHHFLVAKDDFNFRFFQSAHDDFRIKQYNVLYVFSSRRVS